MGEMEQMAQLRHARLTGQDRTAWKGGTDVTDMTDRTEIRTSSH